MLSNKPYFITFICNLGHISHMYLNTIQPNLVTSRHILIVTEERTIQEDLRISFAVQNNDQGSASSAPLAATKQDSKAKPTTEQPNLVCSAGVKEALALVEAAVQENKPFSLVFVDGRLFHGKDYRQVMKRLWQLQPDVQVVLHAVSQLESFEQIPLELGSNHQLLVLKFRLVPFEITQFIRTLTTKHDAAHQSSHRNLSLNAQLLEATTRFEDVSNRLRLEQDHRKQLEDRLCRTQRLETVGRFTDAMAHFFNNYLTVIKGHLEVAQAAQAGRPGGASCLEDLRVATKHAAGITSQFVAFNRREYLQPRPTNLAQIIDSQAALLQKVLGEHITIQINHKADIPAVMADSASLEQTIFSLLIHARESMPQGGRLMIQTRQLHIPDVNSARQVHADARPGDYAVMIISDTGKGMTPAELARLFDASQISAAQESCADIALILLQGMLRLQGGWLTANSVPDVGSEFSIYLPVASGSTLAPATPDTKLFEPTPDNEATTILIVDDEESVRQVMEYVLTSQGHKVLSASDASVAWTLWRSHASVIKLVITDIQMPGGTSGFDLEKAIKEVDATVPVIFTCGYCSTKLSNGNKELKAGENYLSKPFGMVELLNIVGHAMQRHARL